MSKFRELCGLDDPAEMLRDGEVPYTDLFNALCDLDIPEEDARALYVRIVEHEKTLSQGLKRKAGFRLALLDYLLNVDRKLDCPRLVEYERYEQILTQCIRDPLTGILNRRHFDYQAERELLRSRRHGYALSIIFLDLDDFKVINDTCGHAAGDRVLREMADILRDSLRAEDLPARYGGEEFVALLPQTDIGGAQVIGRRLQDRVRRHSFGGGIRVTFSGGASSFPRHGETMAELLEVADRGLYEAKTRGKNDIVIGKAGRRESRRYLSMMPLTFAEEGGPDHGGTVRDVSLSGLAVDADWAPREGQEIMLRFYVDKHESVFEHRARVVWAVKMGGKDTFTLGLRYEPGDDPRILKTFPTLAALPKRSGDSGR